jgi:hypothetical protein
MTVILGDLALLVAVFFSAAMTLAWAELASFPLQGDKSGLAGLLGALAFMAARWSGLAVALALAVLRGGLPALPGGRGLQLAIALGAHLALGVVSYQGLEWINAAIQRDDGGPQRLAWVFAFLLPLPAMLAAAWGLNRDWMPRHRIVTLVLAGLVVWAHVAAWRQGYRAR